MTHSAQAQALTKFGAAAAALAVVVGCALQPKPVMVSDSVEATATVEAID